MKRIIISITTMLFALSICAQENQDFVTINGVKWATRNVGEAGSFVVNPENNGNYFTFDEAQNACPKGFRLPTMEEFKNLFDTGSIWTIKNNINGRLLGSNENTIFLSAAGYRAKHRERKKEEMFSIGTFGGYWSSSTTNDGVGRFLEFNSDYIGPGSGRMPVFSVRCVAE